MKLCIIISLLVIVAVSAARTDDRRRVQSMYRMTDMPKMGVKGAATTHRPLRKGEYICGSRICRLRPGEVPKGCEGGECQYNIGHTIHNRRK